MNAALIAIKIVPRILGIRRSVWIGLGVTLLLTLGLTLWALLAGVSWLWGQAPVAAEAGKRAAGVVIEQVETSVPGAKEQLGVWWPGVKEQLGVWLPGVLNEEATGTAAAEKPELDKPE